MKRDTNESAKLRNPIKRAAGAFDTLRFTEILMTSGLYYSQTGIRPAHMRLMLAVSLL